MDIETAIRIHGADAVFTAAAYENFKVLKTMGIEAYDSLDADYITTVVYNNMMTPEEKEILYQEALADDPLAP